MTDKASIFKTFLAGICGGITLNIVMLLTFRLLGFGWEGGGILIRHSTQSPKLIAIWTELEPIPLVVSRPAPIIIGLILFGIGHAFIYRWLAPVWPQGIMVRTFRMGMLVFFLSFLFWEFFTPFNLFGEPLPLISLELVFWATIAFAEAFVITVMLESKIKI